MIRIAAVGAGFFSQFHFDSWMRLDRAELVAVCDQDISRARASGVEASDNLQELLNDCKPDLLDIILPPAAHGEAIRMGIAAGVKWIICQKPFCQSREEARAVTAEAAAKGARLIVHENFRFQPWYRAIKQQLDHGAIGTPLQASFRLRPGDGQGPDAYLERQPYFQTMPRFLIHETGVHFVDVFRYLFGAPGAVYADLVRLNPAIRGEDAGMVLFDHPGGMRATFDGNRHLDHRAGNLRCTMGEALIEGTDGSLTLQGDGSVWLRPFGHMERQKVLAPSTADTFGGDCVHLFQSHVVDGLLEGTPIETDAADYLHVLDIVEAIYRSDKAGAKIGIETP